LQNEPVNDVVSIGRSLRICGQQYFINENHAFLLYSIAANKPAAANPIPAPKYSFPADPELPVCVGAIDGALAVEEVEDVVELADDVELFLAAHACWALVGVVIPTLLQMSEANWMVLAWSSALHVFRTQQLSPEIQSVDAQMQATLIALQPVDVRESPTQFCAHFGRSVKDWPWTSATTAANAPMAE